MKPFSIKYGLQSVIKNINSFINNNRIVKEVYSVTFLENIEYISVLCNQYLEIYNYKNRVSTIDTNISEEELINNINLLNTLQFNLDSFYYELKKLSSKDFNKQMKDIKTNFDILIVNKNLSEVKVDFLLYSLILYSFSFDYFYNNCKTEIEREDITFLNCFKSINII